VTTEKGSDDAGRWRTLAELASALLFCLGGGGIAILAVLSVFEKRAPHLTVPHEPTILEVLVLIPSVLLVFMAGSLMGGIVLILVWVPFSTTEQLDRFTQPDIPPFSTVLRWVIRKVGK
jgi:hypothetical protein